MQSSISSSAVPDFDELLGAHHAPVVAHSLNAPPSPSRKRDDAGEASVKSQLKEKAVAELEAWNRKRLEEISRRKASHRNERTGATDLIGINGNAWEKILCIIDSIAKDAGRDGTKCDVSRMKNLLISLKSNPPA